MELSTSAAPMTPQTIARIRALAPTVCASRIADDLGWDAARVMRVAQAHRINVRDVLSPAMTDFRPAPEPPLRAPRRPPPIKFTPVQFNSSATMADIYAAIPSVHERVLRMLETRVGEFISCSVIAQCTGLSPQTVARALLQIAKAMAGSRWRIETMSRRNGGFRLLKVQP